MPRSKQYQLLKSTRDERKKGMSINVIEWNRKQEERTYLW